MNNHKYAKVSQPNNFRVNKNDTSGKFEFEKGRYLLNFENDPQCVTEGLRLIKQSADIGFEPAVSYRDKVLRNDLFSHARKMYKFVYGNELI